MGIRSHCFPALEMRRYPLNPHPTPNKAGSLHVSQAEAEAQRKLAEAAKLEAVGSGINPWLLCKVGFSYGFLGECIPGSLRNIGLCIYWVSVGGPLKSHRRAVVPFGVGHFVVNSCWFTSPKGAIRGPWGIQLQRLGV